MILALATSLPAQERGRGGGRQRGGRARGQSVQKDPTYWMSLGTGFILLDQVDDGNTQSLWDFGQGFPLTFSIERAFGSSISAGLAGSYTRVGFAVTVPRVPTVKDTRSTAPADPAVTVKSCSPPSAAEKVWLAPPQADPSVAVRASSVTGFP